MGAGEERGERRQRTASSRGPACRRRRRPSAARRCSTRRSARGAPRRSSSVRVESLTSPSRTTTSARGAAERGERLAEGGPGGDRGRRRRSRGRCSWPRQARVRPLAAVRAAAPCTRGRRMPPSSRMASSASGSGLPCTPSRSSTAATPRPLRVRARITVGAPGSSRRPRRTRGRSRVDVVAVDLDGVPAERAASGGRRRPVSQPCRVGPRWPSRFTSTISGQVVEPVAGRVLERLPHRPLGQLAVPAQHPDAVRQLVEALGR